MTDNVIDRSKYFTTLTNTRKAKIKQLKEERAIAELLGQQIEPIEYQNGLEGFRIFTPDNNDIDDDTLL